MNTTTVNIDGVNVEVDADIVADVITEQSFCIRENIHVTVNIYDNHGVYKMTSWLNGVEELNTKKIEEDISSLTNDQIISMMESFIYENEEYIVDIANWNGD